MNRDLLTVGDVEKKKKNKQTNKKKSKAPSSVLCYTRHLFLKMTLKISLIILAKIDGFQEKKKSKHSFILNISLGLILATPLNLPFYKI